MMNLKFQSAGVTIFLAVGRDLDRGFFRVVVDMDRILGGMGSMDIIRGDRGRILVGERGREF